MGRPVTRIGRALAAAVLLALAFVAPAAAAAPSFEQPTARSSFGEEIVFTQAFASPFDLARVEVLLESPGDLGPFVVEVAGTTAAGSRQMAHHLSLTDGHIFPNTSITARWRLVPADRAVEPAVGPPITVQYTDTRFAWRTLEGDVVRLHWYEGSDAFGRRALAIGEQAVREASAFLGVTESEPIDFFVYADEAAFYDAVGPGTRENVVGTAVASIRTMFALIAPNDVTDAEVRRVVPHELTHLVFDTAVRNPYHSPPLWLNEGVATYLSVGFTPGDRTEVESAARQGRLMPLTALGGLFPTTYARFSLAYAESVSAVDYLVREQGTDALVELVNSYGDGISDDEAFTAALGMDLAAFDEAWMADLGADPPIQHGPQPAPAGPLPSGWEAGATAAPAPSSFPTTTPTGAPAPDDASPLREGWVLVIAALAGLLVGGGLALLRRRRARNDVDASLP
jgi:hypothetical protein